MRHLFFLILMFCCPVKAEVYKDFAPYTSVAEMKANYPNAKFEVVKAAWVQENDMFLKITGSGLPGTIYVATSKTSDAWLKNRIEKANGYIAEHPDQDNSRYTQEIALNERLLARPLDERYTIDWLRWVPDTLIPLERLKAKFGEPDKFDYNESDFQPYTEWTKRSLRAVLSDDKKTVLTIEYNFTEEDNNKALGIEPAPNEAAETPKPTPKKSKSKNKSK